MQLSGLRDLCKTKYSTINHDKLSAFVERWYSETPSVHLTHGDISITLDDVSCILHLLIKGRLLDHDRVIRDEAMELMVTYLGAIPWISLKEIEDIRW